MPSLLASEGVAFSYDASIYFSFADSYYIDNNPAGSGISIDPDLGVITGTPTSNASESSPFTLIVIATNNDGTAQGSLGVVIDPLTPPVLISSFPDLQKKVDDAVLVTFSDYFSGADTYEVTGRPAGSGLIVSESNITGTFTASDSDASPYYITVTATNSDGSTSDTFRIDSLTAPSTTTPINDPVLHVDKFYGDPYKAYTDFEGDNWTRFQFYEEGVAFDLGNIKKLTVTLTDSSGTEYTKSSDVNGNLFNLLVGGGKADVRIGQIGAPIGLYYCDLFYFDSTHLKGVRFTAKRSIIIEVR